MSGQFQAGRPKPSVVEVRGALPHFDPMEMLWSIQRPVSELEKRPLSWCLVRVSEGARTRDNQNHKTARCS